MSTDVAQMKGLKLLLEQTVQRARPYPKTISDPTLRHRAEVAIDHLKDLAHGLEIAIKEHEHGSH